MDSKEQSILYITGKEKVMFMEDFIKDELRKHPHEEELGILRVANALYQFHDQWVVLPQQMVGTPNQLKQLKKIVTIVFGDREGVSYQEQWNERTRTYEARILSCRKENAELAGQNIRNRNLFDSYY